MIVVNASRSARRLLNRRVLGCASALLCALASGCSQTTPLHDEPKAPQTAHEPEAPGPRAEGEAKVDSLKELQPETVSAVPEEAPAPHHAVAATAAPAPVSVARPVPAKQVQNGIVGLSGIGSGGGGRRADQGIGVARGRLGAVHQTRSPNMLPPPPAQPSSENYAHVAENAFLNVADQPLSTFSVDVDTASYSNARRFLNDGALPPKDAIRVEEWLNYFSYDYPEPIAKEPFSVTSEVSACPWNGSHRLVRLGLKSQQISQAETPARNLVFLLDVSGSMMPENKLPLLKRGLSLLAENLRAKDTISIVVYAGASGLALPATSGAERARVLDALGRLEAGGSTNGGDGIRLAYATARQHFVKGGINRVLLATDGDFNVGTSSEGELQRLIEDERKSGVFLTVLGFGEGNVKDSTMEMLADKGNGNYAYIDSIAEARKVLVREAGSTLITIAKDVKLQVEFNPTQVQSYKLIGYENRLLAKEDFNDDKKDAGEIGAGHAVTALYEVVPKGEKSAP
ncbi:MAG TPA: von Willebrand factor type A domain-containing protein, partial [Polyangiaceae bacterium]|nr:von Willebrand factor type A domain-containing protein [Polyangiaceae bacterium]